jgi:hypothetical protein
MKMLLADYEGNVGFDVLTPMVMNTTTCWMLVLCVAFSSALKMEAVCSLETSVNFYRTTRRYIPE